jgi:hypothetical protein
LMQCISSSSSSSICHGSHSSSPKLLLGSSSRAWASHALAACSTQQTCLGCYIAEIRSPEDVLQKYNWPNGCCRTQF